MFANRKPIWTKLFALLIVGSLILSACGAPTATVVEKEVGEPEPTATSAPEPEPEMAETLVVGLGAGFPDVDPNTTTATRVGGIAINMVDPLIWQPELGTFEPGLATEWSVSEDATEYTFKLREDVKFHDGTPFNAAAVKFTFDRIVNPEAKSQTALSLIGPYKETEIVNDYEVIVRFETSYAPFLDSVSQPYLAPVSPTAFERVGEEDWGITEFVATGPYKFISFVADSEVILERNDDYAWGPAWTGQSGPPKIKKIVYKIISELATRTATLETGETQLIEEVNEIDFDRLKDDPNYLTVENPLPGSGRSLMINQMRPPTDELAVRRAMQQGINKQGMVDIVWNGFGSPACGPLTKSMVCFDPAMCELHPYDPEAAKQVLEDAGWVDTDGDGIREKDGNKLVIDFYYRGDQKLNAAIGDFLKIDLAQIGFEVNLFGLSRSGYFDAVRSGLHNFQGWYEPLTDPDLMRIFFHSDNVGGGTNRNNYINEEMDRLLDEAAGETDVAKRCELYGQIQKKVKDEAIQIFLNDLVQLFVHTSKLTGVEYYLGGVLPYYRLAELRQ